MYYIKLSILTAMIYLTEVTNKSCMSIGHLRDYISAVYISGQLNQLNQSIN